MGFWGFGWVFVHPFNTVGIRMSLAKKSSAANVRLSFASYTKNMITNEGLLSVYTGLGAGLIRQIFYATSRLGLFEVFRDEMAKYRTTDFFSRLFTGCVSGGLAALISCPAETTLVRISNDATQSPEFRRNYTGVVNAFQRILVEEGPGAFFSSAGPFVNRAMLVGAVQIGTYDQFRINFKEIGVVNETLNVFYASMTSGLIYSLLTMPLETAKNRLAFQRPDPSTGALLYKSTIQTCSVIVKREGLFSLWNGFPPYYIRCGGHTVTMFLAVDWLRSMYLGGINRK